jgi:hypothetical protein
MPVRPSAGRREKFVELVAPRVQQHGGLGDVERRAVVGAAQRAPDRGVGRLGIGWRERDVGYHVSRLGRQVRSTEGSRNRAHM